MTELQNIVAALNNEPTFTNKFTAANKIIGKGRHCDVIEIFDNDRPDLKLCAKIERDTKDNVLFLEYRNLRTFKDTSRVVKAYAFFIFDRPTPKKRYKKKSHTQKSKYAVLVLENCGTTLSNKLKQRSTNRYSKLAIAMELLFAIEDIHRNGIIHQDIKPENVCISDDNTLKILDLGLSVGMHQQRLHYTKYQTKGTLLPDVVGSFPFLNLSSCKRIPMSYGDDMESVLLLIWSILDETTFPWNGESVNIERHVNELQNLNTIKNTPKAIIKHIIACRNLKFEELPDFDRIAIEIVDGYGIRVTDIRGEVFVNRLKAESDKRIATRNKTMTIAHRTHKTDMKAAEYMQHFPNVAFGDKVFVHNILKCLVPTAKGPRWMGPSRNPKTKTHIYCGPPDVWVRPLSQDENPKRQADKDTPRDEAWLERPLPPLDHINGVFPGLSTMDEQRLEQNNVNTIDDMFVLYNSNRPGFTKVLVDMGISSAHASLCVKAIEDRLNNSFFE